MSDSKEESVVVHNTIDRRFEFQAGDGEPAVLEYTFGGKGVVFDHTYVPESLRGGGIAAKLADAAFAEARRQGWRVISGCSYIDVYLKRHPENADLVAGPDEE